jgi:catechol 2,3-dioxygenase-like lactoylglutathione lyase family enzyme
MLKLNVTSVMVLDQDEALDFYVNKLGLEKGKDIKQGPFRWLTVRDPGNSDVEIFLEEPGPPLHDEATAAQLRELIAKGAMSSIVFQTDDVRGLYEIRLHPGAHRQLLRHRHGPPRPLRQRHPDPPAGEGRPESDGLTWLRRKLRSTPRASPPRSRDSLPQKKPR